MSLTAKQIKEEAMKHSPEERADLADWLWVSAMPHEDVVAVRDAEVARRMAEVDSGAVEPIPGEEVFARIEEKLRKAGV